MKTEGYAKEGINVSTKEIVDMSWVLQNLWLEKSVLLGYFTDTFLGLTFLFYVKNQTKSDWPHVLEIHIFL